MRATAATSPLAPLGEKDSLPARESPGLESVIADMAKLMSGTLYKMADEGPISRWIDLMGSVSRGLTTVCTSRRQHSTVGAREKRA